MLELNRDLILQYNKPNLFHYLFFRFCTTLFLHYPQDQALLYIHLSMFFHKTNNADIFGYQSRFFVSLMLLLPYFIFRFLILSKLLLCCSKHKIFTIIAELTFKKTMLKNNLTFEIFVFLKEIIKMLLGFHQFVKTYILLRNQERRFC